MEKGVAKVVRRSRSVVYRIRKLDTTAYLFSGNVGGRVRGNGDQVRDRVGILVKSRVWNKVEARL